MAAIVTAKAMRFISSWTIGGDPKCQPGYGSGTTEEEGIHQMAAKKKGASVGTGAVAAGKAAKDNPYVQRLIEDEDLRENLRTAYESARNAYARMSNGKGPSAALNDKKTQKQLREAATSLKDAADTLRAAKKPKRRGRGLLLIVVGVGLA